MMWAPVLWQQLFGPGGGNLGAVLRGASDGGDRTGLGVSLRLWSAVTVLPPAWFRPSYLDPPQALFRVEGDRAVLDVGQLPSAWQTLLAVFVAVGIGALVVESARRRGIDSSYAGMFVVVVGTMVAVVTITLLPVELFGVVAQKYRYLWSLAAFGTAVVVGHAACVAESAGGRQATRWIIAPLATATAVGAAPDHTDVAR